MSTHIQNAVLCYALHVVNASADPLSGQACENRVTSRFEVFATLRLEVVVGESRGGRGVWGLVSSCEFLWALVGSKTPVPERPKRASEPPKKRYFLIGVLPKGMGAMLSANKYTRFPETGAS